MEILYCTNQKTIGEFKKEVKCYTWNSLWKNTESYQYIIGFDSKQGVYRNGFYYVKGKIQSYKVYEKDERPGCCHVLLSDSAIDRNWAVHSLKKVIRPDDHVCICALTFFDDTKNERDWNVQFKEGQGFLYRMNNDIFYKYGIKKENITWIHYFTDSKEEMMEKIMNSSILYVPGGAPDWFMKRIKECKLKRILKNYQGTWIGVSAGAMVPLNSYHITPDDEYPAFQYLNGLSMLSGFDIEVHYQATNHQKEYIQRVIKEKNIPVYGIYEEGGLIVRNQKIEMFGKVEVFQNE